MKTKSNPTCPTLHWASSDAEGGRCWCGEVATPEHAAQANATLREDSTKPPNTSRGGRLG